MGKQIVNKEGIEIPSGTMEDFKRPNHPDFATSAELREQQWSGIRHNSISDSCEIWLLGEMRASISKQATQMDPRAIDKAYAEVFSLNEVLPDIPELKNYRARRKENGN